MYTRFSFLFEETEIITAWYLSLPSCSVTCSSNCVWPRCSHWLPFHTCSSPLHQLVWSWSYSFPRDRIQPLFSFLQSSEMLRPGDPISTHILRIYPFFPYSQSHSFYLRTLDSLLALWNSLPKLPLLSLYGSSVNGNIAILTEWSAQVILVTILS